jgi:hypothetical protein
LKRTLLQAENQENSEKQPFTHSDSQTKRQRNSQSTGLSQHEKSDFNIGKLKSRFNTNAQRNSKDTSKTFQRNFKESLTMLLNGKNITLKSQSYNSSTPLFPSSPSSIRVNPKEEKRRCER